MSGVSDAGTGLGSWNDTPATQAIVEFVDSATREGDAGYIPLSDRVAVFDNDGTVWCEKPMPIELGFILRRLAEMCETDTTLRDKHPWKAAHEKDFAWLGNAMTKHYHGDDNDLKVLMPASSARLPASRWTTMRRPPTSSCAAATRRWIAACASAHTSR
jgi:hypothetical protein